MWRRVLVLLRARLAAQREGSSLPIAALLLQMSVSGVLCGLVRDFLPPFPYGVFALSVTGALVALPLLGELASLLTSDEAADWIGAQPVRVFELRLARTLHLLSLLAVLALGSLLPAAIFAPASLGLDARAWLVIGGLELALLLAAVLLALHTLFRGGAQAVLVLAQTALFAFVIVGAAVGLRHVPTLAAIGSPGALPGLAFYPPAWFAAPLSSEAMSWGWRGVGSIAAAASVLVLLLAPAPPAQLARTGEPLLGRLLRPLRVLATRIWVRQDERASFHLVFDALPKEREFVIRTYPLIAVPIAFLAVGARGEGSAAREGLLALLLFTPAAYLPILLAHVPGSRSHAARWLSDTAPIERAALENGALKAVAVRFVLPLYVLLALLAWSQGGLALVTTFAVPSFLIALLVMRATWRTCVADLPLSTAPEELLVHLDWLGLLGGLALGLTVLAVLAVKLAVSWPVALAISIALIALEIAGDRAWRRSPQRSASG